MKLLSAFILSSINKLFNGTFLDLAQPIMSHRCIYAALKLLVFLFEIKHNSGFNWLKPSSVNTSNILAYSSVYMATGGCILQYLYFRSSLNITTAAATKGQNTYHTTT